jgi:hypothetical protein
LQAQIAQLSIENPLSLNEFLTPNDETVINKDENIFESVMEHYSINKPGEESHSSNKEEEVKEVDTAEALKCVELLKLWKLQKGNDQDLQALDRLGREIVRYKSSTAIQTTIYRFFKPIVERQGAPTGRKRATSEWIWPKLSWIDRLDLIVLKSSKNPGTLVY